MGCTPEGFSYSELLPNTLAFLQDRSMHAPSHLRSIRLALGREPKDKLFEEGWYRSPELETLCETLAKGANLLSSMSGSLEPI